MPEFDELSEGRRTAAGRGSPHRTAPEAGHDPVDYLSIPVLTDEDMRLCSTVGEGHHELPPVPERDDQTPALTVQLVHGLGSFCPDADGLPQESDQTYPDGRDQRLLQPREHV